LNGDGVYFVFGIRSDIVFPFRRLSIAAGQ
jgi:hypothetical protein